MTSRSPLLSRNPRARASAVVFWVALALLTTPIGTDAAGDSIVLPSSNHGNAELPYQPIKPANFKGDVPADSPHGAEVATGVAVEHSTSSREQPGGTWVTTLADLKYSAIMNENKSWNKKPGDADLLKHEQGHFDLSELEARKRNRDKQSVIDSLKGEGATAGAAEAALDEKLTEHLKKVNEELKKKQEEYDTETDHGQNQKQQEWNQKIEQELKADKPQGTQVESKSKRSVHYDAAAKRLSFSDDVFTRLIDAAGVPLPNDDALLGAELRLPTFLYVGDTIAGDPFFLAEQPAVMSAVEGSTTYFTLDLPYLVYFNDGFSGLSPSTSPLLTAGSEYLAAMRAAFEAGDPFLIGIQIRPELNFYALTAGFTLSGSSPFTNGFGAATVSAPAPVMLLAPAFVMVWYRERRRRRRHVSKT